MKSKHIIYYVFNYDNINLKNTNLIEVEADYDNELFYDNFTHLFSDSGLIKSYENKDLKDRNLILKNEIKPDITFKLTKHRIRLVQTFKVGLIELYLNNENCDDFLSISRHIFKNESYNKFDSFNGIFLDNMQIVTSDTNFSKTQEYLNNVFFNKSISGFNLALGRKNFQITSIIDDTLSKKAQEIYNEDDLTLYRLATGEKNKQIGHDTYKIFLNSIYDKWIKTGSIYILNNHVLLQVVNNDNANFTKAPMNMYNKIVTITLIQKVIFIKFQNKSHDFLVHSKFNLFISKFFFIEVSHDNQSQHFYETLKNEFKLDQYHQVVKEEINLINANKTTNWLLIMTFLYTSFALISILMSL